MGKCAQSGVPFEREGCNGAGWCSPVKSPVMGRGVTNGLFQFFEAALSPAL